MGSLTFFTDKKTRLESVFQTAAFFFKRSQGGGQGAGRTYDGIHGRDPICYKSSRAGFSQNSARGPNFAPAKANLEELMGTLKQFVFRSYSRHRRKFTRA